MLSLWTGSVGRLGNSTEPSVPSRGLLLRVEVQQAKSFTQILRTTILREGWLLFFSTQVIHSDFYIWCGAQQ